jgi:hypothetical protein
VFEYLYDPAADTFISSIRDRASVWDAEMLGDFLGRDAVRPLLDTSLRHYERYLLERDGAAILDCASALRRAPQGGVPRSVCARRRSCRGGTNRTVRSASRPRDAESPP